MTVQLQCVKQPYTNFWHSTAESSVITTKHKVLCREKLLKDSYSHVNQGSTVRRTEAQLSALLATESTWLWEGSCNRKGNAGARSAHTVPGNIKLFISHFFLRWLSRKDVALEQLPCPMLRDTQPGFLFPAQATSSSSGGCTPCPSLHGQGVPGLPPPHSLRGKAFEWSKTLSAALGALDGWALIMETTWGQPQNCKTHNSTQHTDSKVQSLA